MVKISISSVFWGTETHQLTIWGPQLSINHRLNSFLPTNPEQNLSIQQWYLLAKDKITTQTNITMTEELKNISSFKPNDSVRRWIPAKLVKPLETPHSYIVKCSNDSQLRLN